MKTRRLMFRSRMVVALLTATTFFSAGEGWAAPTAASTAELAKGAKAAREKKWVEALAAYKTSHAASPSSDALAGIANAQFQLGANVEAFEAYDELLKSYGAGLKPTVRAQAETRMRALSTTTGALSIRVDEDGASVLIDGVEVGTTPLPLFKRVSVGTHRVRIVKFGFVPVDITKDVAANGTVTVELKLTHEKQGARLVVRETSGQGVRVLVDGVDVGPAPWEGDVDPGKHTVMVRSATAASEAQTVELLRGAREEVVATARSATARLEVRTSDGLGTIYIDGKAVSEGSYAADMAVGPHEIEVRREGFDTYKKTVTLTDKQSVSESVTLRRPGESLTDRSGDAERIFQGAYGGFSLIGLKALGGMGTSLETRCGSLGSASCDTASPLGGSLQGYFGYTWNPVGFELVFGGGGDVVSQTANMTGTAMSGGNALYASPARTENFTFVRIGGYGGIRLRLSAQVRHVRFSLAAGFAAAYRVLLMERSVSTPTGYSDKFVPGATSYVAPAVTTDAAIHWRMTPGTALSLGLSLWVENAGAGSCPIKNSAGAITIAGDGACATADSNRYLTNGTKPPIGLGTPNYTLASGT